MFANAMAVFKLLDKSNCRKCNEATCLAFASKVFLGQRDLSECPGVDPEVIARYTDIPGKGFKPGESDYERELAAMRQRVREIDLDDAARRTRRPV
jgi:Na+-translocating ferredoxin:NAD+ oxidoreductase RNF subunit RnfB